ANAGWATDIVGSAEAAAAAFGRSPYAMVMVETDGLRLDGFEVARRLREAEKPGVRTPLIALTADVLQCDRKKRKAAGFDNYTAKPIRPQALESMLARYTEPEAPSGEPVPQLAAFDERCISDFCEMVKGNAGQFKELMETCLADVMELIDALRRAEED